MDKTGKVLIEPVECYEFIDYYSEGYARVHDSYSMAKTGVVDKTGKFVVPYGKYSYISEFVNGVAVVSEEWFSGTEHEANAGLIDKTGKEIVPFGRYDRISDFVDGYAIVSNYRPSEGTTASGVIDTAGNEIVPFGTYKRIREFKDGIAVVERDGKYGYIKLNNINSGSTPANTGNSIDTAADWAKDAIIYSIQKGFVPEDIQNNYKDTITRAEFCRMAVKWLEYKTGKTIDAILSEKGVERDSNWFSDTQDSDILAAFALGITSGTVSPTDTSPGLFSPNEGFDRQQASTMIRNVCRAYGMETGNVSDQGFNDIGSAAGWAIESINFCRANGIMNGTSTEPLMFSPLTKYSRQESIMTFYNISQ